MSQYTDNPFPMSAMLEHGNQVRLVFKDAPQRYSASIIVTVLDYNMAALMYVHPTSQMARVEPWHNIDYIEELKPHDDVGSTVQANRRELVPVAS